MTSIEVRVVSHDEMPEVQYWVPHYSLTATPPMPDKAERLEMLRQRQGVTCVALYEDGKPMSTAASTVMTQNVRGKLFPAAGVWGVATHPAARRKGYSRRVLTVLLGACRDQGQALSTLYPFRECFYQRLGYAAFPMLRTAKFAPPGLQPLLRQDLGGEIELLSVADGYDAYHAYLKQIQPSTHGMGVFDFPDKARALQRNNVWVALARVGDAVEGVMLYALKGTIPTRFTLNAQRFYYHTSRGRYLLLDWIGRHIDQAEAVEIVVGPAEQPELWWPDLRVEVERWLFPPMGRVLEVASLGGMQVAAGEVTLQISDPHCEWNNGVWRFASDQGALAVEPSSREPDAAVTIQGLAALIYGTHDPADFCFRGWGEPSPEIQPTLRALFPPMTVHLHEVF